MLGSSGLAQLLCSCHPVTTWSDSLYRQAWPLIRLLPPELAHSLALLALRIHVPRYVPPPGGGFTWGGLTFRNRIGIAAGFDKSAQCLSGVERLGVGFLEVGTVSLAPWPGLQDRPRVRRLLEHEAIWNRMGFPNDGCDRVRERLARYRQKPRGGMRVGCNIGPTPGVVAQATDAAEYLLSTSRQLQELAHALFDYVDYFVVNLSSPNTRGLRGILGHPDLTKNLLVPLRERLRSLDAQAGREVATPLLLKLPPEDLDRVPWSHETLSPLIVPILEAHAADGFVATNTSTYLSRRLAAEFGSEELPGGVSGNPLRPLALSAVRLVRALAGNRVLVVGSGGVSCSAHAREFLEAGADLVELYSGMVYTGPGLVRRCIAGLAPA